MLEDATRDFGAFLKDARERAGIDLHSIAANTKISMQSLEALERNDVSRLPGGIFLRAFVRAYAREVGLDPETTVGRFVARFPDAAAVEELTRHDAVEERRVLADDAAASQIWRMAGWSLPFVLVIVFFAFGGRLGWLANLVHPAASRTQDVADQPPPGPETPVMAAPASAPPPPTPEVLDTNPAIPATETATPPAPAVETASAGVRPAETITSPATEGRFRMMLAASARCWVTVRSDGAVVFSGTMQPGDRQNLVLGGSVSLTVGNAAAISVELDGRASRPLGGQGEVKTVRLTAQTLKDFVETR